MLAGRGLLSVPFGLSLAAGAALMAALRIRQALRILVVRASLAGRAMQVITTRELEALTREPEQVFLGFGFEWQPVHSQRLYELAKIDYKDYAVSPRLLRLLGYAGEPAARRRDRPALHPRRRAARSAAATARCRTSKAAPCWWAPRRPARAWRSDRS